MGKDHAQAAREGTDEIGLAVMATTFAIVAVFVPVAFMRGIIGKFFFQFGITVAVAVLVSLFVSFTLDPMLSASGAIRREHRFKVPRAWLGPRMLDASSAALRRTGVYGRVLAWAPRTARRCWRCVRTVLRELRRALPLSAPSSSAERQGLHPAASTRRSARAWRSTTQGAPGRGDRARPSRESMLATHDGRHRRRRPQLRRASRIQLDIDRAQAQAQLAISSARSARAEPAPDHRARRSLGNRPIYVPARPDPRRAERSPRRLMAKLAKVPGIVDLETSVKPGNPALSIAAQQRRGARLGITVQQAASAAGA